MQTNTHGLISLFLFFMAIVVALGAVFPIPKSAPLGLMYLGITILCFINILYSYCAKCPCRASGCSHGLPGRLTAYLPKRKEGPYSFIDILSTLLSLGAILVIPHLWLVYNIPSLVLFWLLMILAGLETVFLVCPDCSNRHCFLCARKNKLK